MFDKVIIMYVDFFLFQGVFIPVVPIINSVIVMSIYFCCSLVYNARTACQRDRMECRDPKTLSRCQSWERIQWLSIPFVVN